MPDPVPNHSAEELLRRAVIGCRSRRYPRWHMVKETFCLGSTYAALLCRWAGVDPDEQAKQ